MRRVRAYIGLGANLGDPTRAVAGGVRALAALRGTRLHAVSPAVRDRAGRGRRPAARSGTRSSRSTCRPARIPRPGAVALLVALKQLERAFGRQERERWGPRELDLDLLVFGRARLSIDRPPDGRVARPRQGRPAARRPASARPPSGCSSSPRSPTSRRGWCRRAGRETVATAAAAPARRRGPGRGPADRDLGRRPRRVASRSRERPTQAPRKRVGRPSRSRRRRRPARPARPRPPGRRSRPRRASRSRKTSAAPSSTA